MGDDRVQQFWNALTSEPSDADCERCLELLDRYVAAQQAGDDYRRRYAWVAQHLDLCPDCAVAYALLYEAAGAAPPATIPDPDLSFLPSAPSLAERISDALHIAGEKLVLQLSAELRTLLQPPALPSLATTRDANGDRYGEQLLLLSPEQAPGVPLTLAVYRDAQQPAQALVEVVIMPPGQSWPDLGGKTVILTWKNERRTSTTDDWGIALFYDVPLAALDDLRLQAEPLTESE